MKIYSSLFLVILCCIGFCSCQKNIDLVVIDPQLNTADTVWQNNLSVNSPVISLKNDIKNVMVADSFSFSNSAMVFASANLFLAIPINALSKNNGLFPNGTIKRVSLLLQKKGDFIAMGIPTTSYGRLLISGGAFFVGLKNNNDELLVTPGNKLTVRFLANAASAPSQNNKIYNLSTDSSVDFNWVLNNDTAFNKSFVTLNGYEIQTNKLNYVQTAHLMDTAGIAQTTIAVKLPSNYTNTNTTVYASFNTLDCVTSFAANINNRVFQSPLLPVNKTITITVISKQAGDYYLGTQQTLTMANTSGSSNQIVIITPVKKSLESIKAYLNSL